MADRNAAKKPAPPSSGDDPVPASRLKKRRKRDAQANPVDLDRVIHERVRLAIVSALAVNESLTFTELKTVLDTSDGNLSVHARRLEDVGYVSCTKSFDGRVPRTEFRLTAAGRRALQDYLSHMESLIRHVRDA